MTLPRKENDYLRRLPPEYYRGLACVSWTMTIHKSDVDEKFASKISPMPAGLLNSLTKDEILDLHVYLENGEFQLPEHLRKQHLPQAACK